MLGNINRSSEKTEPFSPTDFMPWVEITEKEVQKPIEHEPIDSNTQAVRLKALFSKKGKL
ncbi:hypothetical protein UFOVP14_17 [uncultured Caudovirales phage]|uniref:Uncharacterized protein n=1 Tax=uncultured Caudovirales phage TaxID=2100421 RepID=A0A6J5KJ13_9CAUD|nr:hypothetical protein UFOVP14_17 [uncultured Caudovirales phage]